jgi:hypothetical protein
MSNLGNEIENIVAAIQATPGWRIEDGRYWKAFAPDRKTLVIISKTPGSQRRIHAYRAQLGKLGVDFRSGRKRRR